MKKTLYMCFFLSGAAGLLYEIYWAQRFGLLLGVDVYSHAAVLTAFMGGLALGSHLMGRWADRFTRPLGVYVLLEAGIALSGLMVPVVLPFALGPMRWMYAWSEGQPQAMMWFRFLIAFVVLIIPTALMGGTLPVMSRVLRHRGDRLGVVVGHLYAVNTIGAVLGILAGGFILSEWIGLQGTNFVAVALNLAAAGLAYSLFRNPAFAAAMAEPVEIAPALDSASEVREGETHEGLELARADGAQTQSETMTAPIRESAVDSSYRAAFLIALCAGLTGAAAMITQLGWIRTITLMIGSSSYAFTLVVAVFLIGLSLGSWLVVRGVNWWSDAAVPWAYSCILTAIFSWITMWALGGSPGVVQQTLLSMYERDVSIPRIYTALGLMTFLVLAAPTIILGMTFPLACETYAQRFLRGTGRITGALYAVNTIGAMLGSTLGGLILIGLLGIQGSLNAAAALYLAAGLAIASVADRAERKRFPGVVGLTVFAAAAALLGSLSWSRETLMSAPYLLRDYVPEKLLYYREAPEATVAVNVESLGKGRNNIALLINGKPDASSIGDLGTQVLLAQVPMLLHGKAQNVGIIGLGAGVTLSSALTHPVKTVDLVEISPAVVDAVRPPSGAPGPFDHVNHRPFDDPRVRLIIGDGRNHLALTDRKYDVIISEPSNPWCAGVASLFTREFFESCRGRLQDDGILCQWVQAYDLPIEELLRVIRTMGEVFDNVTVWGCPPIRADFIVIGTQRTSPSLGSVAELMQQPAIRDDLARISIANPAQFFGNFILDAAELDDVDGVRAMAELAANTDNWNKLAFTAVRALWQDQSLRPDVVFWDQRTLPLVWTGPLDIDDSAHQSLIRGIQDQQDATWLQIRWDETHAMTYGGTILQLGVTWVGYDDFLGEMKEHANCNHPPSPEELKSTSASIARESLAQITDQSDPHDAQRAARLARVHALIARQVNPRDGQNVALLAEALWRMGRMGDARTALKWALEQSATVRPELKEAILPEAEDSAPEPP